MGRSLVTVVVAAVMASMSAARPLLDTTKFDGVEDVVEGYIAWAQSVLKPPQCVWDARFIVWTPQAGIGDAAFSFATAFAHAVRSSRVLLIDWKFPLTDGGEAEVTWRDLLAPPYEWDWADALSSGTVCPPATDGVDPAVTFMTDMSFTSPNARLVQQEAAEHPSHAEIGLGGMEPVVIQRFFQPSTAVQELMDPVLPQLDGKFVVAAVIRTGWTEDSLPAAHKFLDSGDEELFLSCLVAAYYQLKDNLKASGSNRTASGVAVLLLSDSKKVLRRFREDKRLQSSPYFNVVFGADPSADGSGALSHVNKRSAGVLREGIFRSFAEWFLLGRSQVAFLTANSLFGDSGSVRAGDMAVRRYVINKRTCKMDPRMGCAQDIERERTALHTSCPALLQAVPLDPALRFDPWLPASEVYTTDRTALRPRRKHTGLR